MSNNAVAQACRQHARLLPAPTWSTLLVPHRHTATRLQDWGFKIGVTVSTPRGRVKQHGIGNAKSCCSSSSSCTTTTTTVITRPCTKGFRWGVALAVMLDMGVIWTQSTERVFPDVFGPAWARHVRGVAPTEYAPRRNNQNLLRHFPGNELNWGGKFPAGDGCSR